MASTEQLIEECITYEETERDAADACDRHFWDGWDANLVRQGSPMVRATVSAPGLGKTSIFTYMLVIALPNGTYASVREPVTERVATARAARYDGREGYARRRAVKVFGVDAPVDYQAMV